MTELPSRLHSIDCANGSVFPLFCALHRNAHSAVITVRDDKEENNFALHKSAFCICKQGVRVRITTRRPLKWIRIAPLVVYMDWGDTSGWQIGLGGLETRAREWWRPYNFTGLRARTVQGNPSRESG